MPSRFETHRRPRARLAAPPPLVTRQGVATFAALCLALLVVPAQTRLLYALFLAIMALKLLAPVVTARSRTHNGFAADTLYITGFVLPHLPSLALVALPGLAVGRIGPALALLLFGALLFCSLNVASVRQHFDRKLMRLVPAKSDTRIALDSAVAMLSAVGQELLHRGLVILVVLPYGGFACFLASAVTFVLEHVMNRWSRVDFTLAAYTRYTLVSLLAVAAVFAFGGVLPAIMLHLGYNLVVVSRDVVHAFVASRASAEVHDA